MIWWLAFEKKPFQFLWEIWIQVVAVICNLVQCAQSHTVESVFRSGKSGLSAFHNLEPQMEEGLAVSYFIWTFYWRLKMKSSPLYDLISLYSYGAGPLVTYLVSLALIIHPLKQQWVEIFFEEAYYYFLYFFQLHYVQCTLSTMSVCAYL